MVDYATSGFHRIGYPGDTAPDDVLQPEWFANLNVSGVAPLAPRYYSIEAISSWRQRFADTHAVQIEERPTWDEADDFLEYVQVDDECMSALRFATSLIEERGPDRLQDLRGLYAVFGRQELCRIRNKFAEPAVAQRFPQLLGDASYWLPFQRNLVLESVDWGGQAGWFGSSFRFADELLDIRSLIVRADTDATNWTNGAARTDDPLRLAWMASEGLAILGMSAVRRHLPIWLAG